MLDCGSTINSFLRDPRTRAEDLCGGGLCVRCVELLDASIKNAEDAQDWENNMHLRGPSKAMKQFGEDRLMSYALRLPSTRVALVCDQKTLIHAPGVLLINNVFGGTIF